MLNKALTTMGLFLSLPCLLAGNAAQDVEKPGSLSYGAVNRRVAEMLRHSGERLLLDQDQQSGTTMFRSVANKIYYHTNPKDNRLVRIEIVPNGEETPETSKLAASFLMALSAVDSIEDGTTLADMLTTEINKDGLTRSITLKNGMKFMKVKTENSSFKFVIYI